MTVTSRKSSRVIPVTSTARTSPYQSRSSVFRIPEAQRIKILERHLRGESIRKISKAEHRCRETVARVVNSDEMEEILQQKRAEFLALADDAIDAVRDALRNSKDRGWLGLEILKALQIMPSPAATRIFADNTSLRQSAELPSTPPETRIYCERLASAAMERSKAFSVEISEIVPEQDKQSVPKK